MTGLDLNSLREGVASVPESLREAWCDMIEEIDQLRANLRNAEDEIQFYREQLEDK